MNCDDDHGSLLPLPVEISKRVPPEVWEYILDYLENDPGSRYNSSKVCQLWRNLISIDYVAELFQLVLPHVAHFLSKSNLLSCRLVCKQWRQGVDTFLQESYHSPEFLSNDGMLGLLEWYHCPLLWLPCETTFKTVQNLTEFINEMSSHTGNPFPTRCVRIYRTRRRYTREDHGNFYKLVTDLITRFGDHIWSMYYTAYSDMPASQHAMQFLFRHLPNLRHLSIIDNPGFGVDCFGYDNPPPRTSPPNWIRNPIPLPDLPHLFSLHLYEDVKHVTDFLLQKYAQQLTIFHGDTDAISKCHYFQPKSLCQNRTLLPKVHHLKIDKFMENVTTLRLNNLCHLEVPCLKSIMFEYIDGMDYPQFSTPEVRRENIRTLINICNHFAPIIEEFKPPQRIFEFHKDGSLPVSIHDPIWNDMGRLASAPNLKVIHVWIRSLVYPLTRMFLMRYCFHVELVKLIGDARDFFETMELAQMKDIGPSTVADRLWEWLPNLQGIKSVGNKNVELLFAKTREDYEARKKMGGVIQSL